ncbi:Repressor of drug resistance 1 [Hyphodiscus hymeniophilus]|uniref:Repressor of drug resistance 1 n=1 Tax=Hyphodiscus hymeniophilus TaxID=353542 RepID=A0A9P6SK91_9HELO|nr:Repressor of drug resistance 1 [Hyphodiscus hymeniophilus]
MPPQRTVTSSKEGKVRQRSSKACQPCRKRKIKCDGKDPCEACVGYGYDCVYIERQPHKALSSTLAGSPIKDDSNINDAVNGPLLEPKVIGPYMATESVVTNPEAEGFLLRSLKTRFTSAYSAIAWPKALGASLDMPIPPRLQSFAWNPGNRAESKVMPQHSLTSIISQDEMKRYTDVFFNDVNPIFGLVDREIFARKSEELWILHKRGTDFESVTCGMVALGSFFSPDPLPAEAQVVEHLRLLLDLTVAHAPGWLALNHIQAWILRAIYLRSTTRPHLAWMASNTAVHLAEALGLHRDLCETQMKQELRRLLEKSEVTMRRRIFWVAMALNQFLAAEYGRARASVELVSCLPPDSKSNELFLQTLAIFQSVPKTQNLLGRGPELLETLQSAMALPAKAPFLGLLRADACFCTFRMLRSTNSSLSNTQIAALLEVIRVALDATTFLATLRQPWWNIIGTSFHSVCILLSLDTSASLAMIPSALETLKNVSTTYDSHLSREAIYTACALVDGAREKKRKEMNSLDRGIDVVGSILPSPGSGSVFSGGADLEWSMNNDLGLSDFLDFGGYGFDNDVFPLPNAGLFTTGDHNGTL